MTFSKSKAAVRVMILVNGCSDELRRCIAIDTAMGALHEPVVAEVQPIYVESVAYVVIGRDELRERTSVPKRKELVDIEKDEARRFRGVILEEMVGHPPLHALKREMGERYERVVAQKWHGSTRS